MIPLRWILVLALPFFVETCRLVPRSATITTEALGGRLADEDFFGDALASPGDVDGDGVPDLLVGAPFDDSAGPNRGAVWLLNLDRHGQVLEAERVTGSTVHDGDRFGLSLAVLEDPRGLRLPRVAVGACRYVDWFDYGVDIWSSVFDFRSANAGVSPEPGSDAVRILEFDAGHRLREVSCIARGRGGFAGSPEVGDNFGSALASLGDLDGDGVADLAVGANHSTENVSEHQPGSVWIVFLNDDGTAARHVRIGAGDGGFTGELEWLDGFGSALATLGDLDGDGTVELAVGAPRDDTSGTLDGAVWILSLARDGRVVAQHREVPGPAVPHRSGFGSALALLGDRDGDGRPELLVGAVGAGPHGAGAAWIFRLDAGGRLADPLRVRPHRPPERDELFGKSACRLPDVNGDGIEDFAVGAPGYDADPYRSAWWATHDDGAVHMYVGTGR